MSKVVSFDLKADFGFLKKPFSNEKLELYLTFNFLHKPALLGILGAILGLKGYTRFGELPDYYRKLKNLKVGIEPIKQDDETGIIFHEKGIFNKTTTKYNNTVGYANKQGGTLNINEQTIIKPAFRCYLKLDSDVENSLLEKLYEYIMYCRAEYLPYFGKNDYGAWWMPESVIEYKYIGIEKSPESIEICTIFNLEDTILQSEKGESFFDIFNLNNPFVCFERLPVGFEKVGNSYQYKIMKFAYSNFAIKRDTKIPNIYQLKDESENLRYVQLF